MAQLARAGDPGASPQMAPEPRYEPIGDYAIIGDCRSAALVSLRGSIDWLCLPHFDSPPVFGALLDAGRGGRFVVQPRGPFDSRRRYLPDSNVIETTFTTSSGEVRLTDAMPVAGEETKARRLLPIHELLRVVEGVSGEVELEVLYRPREGYEAMPLRLRDRGAFGVACGRRGRLLLLRSEVPLAIDDDLAEATGRVRVAAGERRALSVTYCEGEPAVAPCLGDDAARRIEDSVAWWQSWVDRCAYSGPHRDQVVRSLLTIKQLTFAPSGAVIAALTTSLPESPGGARNWDYRYCWLRDASMTLLAFLELGYCEEARAFLDWLLHTTRRTAPQLQTMYDIFGSPHLGEHEIHGLRGYRDARPVRVGNAAHGQLQLDTYGEVLEAVYQYVERGGRLDRATARLIVGLGREVQRCWNRPDEGIWEIRSRPLHHTHSKALCWATLDRILELHHRGALRCAVPAADFAETRDAIRASIEQDGFDRELDSYVSHYGGETLDASLLLLPVYKYLDFADPRMVGTTERIAERLKRGPLLYRYLDKSDGLSGSEGTFVISSFWYVIVKARQGEVDEAEELFCDLIGYQNDVGLYAEEIEVPGGAALGNFPQAFSHVGLINAAFAIAEARGEHERGEEEKGERV